jgi:uncharacterized protein YcbX
MATQQLTNTTPTFGGALVTVTGLYHYPIKSCAGIALPSATLDPRGIRHDRELMIVDAVAGTFLTQRELPRMALIAPRLADGALIVTAPGMTELTVPVVTKGSTRPVSIWRDTCEAVDQGDTIAEWLSAFLGHGCRLVRMADDFTRIVDQIYATSPTDQVGFADGFPCLLIAEESLADLNARLDAPLLMNRFRPNIVIAGGAPFGEDRVAVLRIGEIVFHATKSCARCPITTVEQETGETGKEPLRTFATFRRAKRGVLFGQNLIHASTGTITVGDRVEALEAKEPEA